MKLNKREQIALKEIARYRGSYSMFWTPKTNISLFEKGLVVFKGNCVAATDKGIEMSKEEN